MSEEMRSVSKIARGAVIMALLAWLAVSNAAWPWAIVAAFGCGFFAGAALIGYFAVREDEATP